MYYTHHFAHPETLDRVHSWLSRLGFSDNQIETRTDGVLRLSVTAAPAQITEARQLINAIERADPDGFPTFWNESRQPHHDPAAIASPVAPAATRPRSTPIGWHPENSAPSSDWNAA